MKHEFDLQSAIIEAMLLGGGNSFTNDMMIQPIELPMGERNNAPSAQVVTLPSGKKCCGGTSPSCKGCDNCGPR